MSNLLAAAIFLPASHFLISATPLRAALIARLGMRTYLAAYSLIALGAFAWLIVAYRDAPMEMLFTPVWWLSGLAAGLSVFSIVLIVCSLTTRNPVLVLSHRLLREADIVRGTLRITRHGFFWGAGLLSLSHIAMAGDAATALAFGSIAVLGLPGGAIMDARKAAGGDPRFHAFLAATSDIPFLAIAQGRQRLVLREIGALRVAGGVAAAAAIFLLHGVA